MARADSGAATFYGVQTSENLGSGNTPTLNIVKSVSGTLTNLATFTLSSLGPLNYGTEYNIKFLVQTDAGNSNLTDLKADVWQQGTTDPGWQLSTTDNTAQLNGAGANASGYGGIWSSPDVGPSSGDTSDLSNYVESNTPGDLPEIKSFTSTPPGYSGTTYPQTITFNASASAPATGSITSYSLNFGDGNTLTSSAAMVNVTHSYTAKPAFAYAATLTITDSSGGTASQEIWAAANSSVTTDPTAVTLGVDRDGGNGVSAGTPLIVHFTTSGTASTSDALADYILNFGDGSPIMNMPVSGGTTGQTWSNNTDHAYTVHGAFDATLTLVGADGAATVKTQSILITGNTSPPTVTTSYNTSTSVLSAVFSKDIGAALVSQTSGSPNYTPLGESIWVDSTASAGSIAGALDIRNDNGGGNMSLTSAPFAYNSTNFTATWNLSGLLNISSTSYTARLFATQIQDQAGNDLDGINSGVGGQDATLHLGSSYTPPTVTLATGGVWNTSMPLIFAPSIAPDSIQSLATTYIAGNSSTTFNFTVNSTNTAILKSLASGDPVIIEDMAAGFTALDGQWNVNAVTDNGATDSITIPTQPYNSSQLSGWSAGAAGSMHISPTYGSLANNLYAASPETELISALEQITGATSIPMTGKVVSSGVYVGETPQFDTNTVTDPTGYSKSFDNEAELGQTGYIVNSIGSDLIVAGGGSCRRTGCDRCLPAKPGHASVRPAEQPLWHRIASNPERLWRPYQRNRQQRRLHV